MSLDSAVGCPFCLVFADNARRLLRGGTKDIQFTTKLPGIFNRTKKDKANERTGTPQSEALQNDVTLEDGVLKWCLDLGHMAPRSTEVEN